MPVSIKYPCMSCKKEVRNDHNALLCVSCNKWAHLKCSRASINTFNSDVDWICDACLLNELPHLDLDSDKSDIVSILPTKPMDNEQDCQHIHQSFDKLKSSSGINIAHLNICSLLRNMDEIRHMLLNENIHILSLSETRLDSSVPDSEIHIEGYQCVRVDRNRNGGGIITYVQENVHFNVRKDLFIAGLEVMCLEVYQVKQKPFFVVYWYRPPDSSISVYDKIETLFQSLESTGNNVVFYGDFNCDLLKNPPSCHTKRLNCLTEDFELKQYVVKPTRVTLTTSTLIDVLYASKDKVTFCDVIPVSLSDHYMVVCSLGKTKIPSIQHKFVYCRNLRKINLQNFKSDLSQVSWDDVLNDTDSNNAFDVWLTKFNLVLNKHAPLRKKRVRQKESPWMNADILNKIRERNAMRKKANLSKSEDDWKTYKKLRNGVTAAIRKAKSLYVSENILSNKGNSTAMWKSIRRLLPKKVNASFIQKLIIDEEEIIGSKNIASSLNNHFVNLAAKRKRSRKFGNNMKRYMSQVQSTFCFKEVSQDDVINYVNEIPRNKATGLDEIPTGILKDSIEYIVEPITHIINLSLKTGKIPKVWKQARVTPIHKGGDNTNPSNYRPISVLPVLSKVMEKMVFNQVYAYLSENNLLTKYQHGFRPGHSTQTALISLTDDISKHVDEGYVVAVITLDLEKAFDLISFDILLKKLTYFGFDKRVIRWFEDYFHEREQLTVVNGNRSTSKTVQSGVPQGSILGPLLFILTLNDLYKSVSKCSLSLYADDTCLYFAAKDKREMQKVINDDLKSMFNWFSNNHLLLNIDKCQFMLIGSKGNLRHFEGVNISIQNTQLRRVSQCKYLGVIIDSHLTWTPQIEEVKKKALKTFHSVKRVRQFLDKRTSFLLYQTLIQSQLDYCSMLWMNGHVTQLAKLQTLQNRCFRLILGVDSRFNRETLYRTLEAHTLGERRKIQALVIIYKLLHNLAPLSLSSRIQLRSPSHYSLRSVNTQIVLPRPRTNFLRNSALYSASKLFNKLPISLRSTNDIKIFTKELKKII